MVDINQKLKRAEDGPLGQHVDENDQLVITGENNPLPSKDKEAHARLDAIEAALGGTLNTQLTGSSIQEGNPLPSKITDSSFALPVDLQYSDLLDSEAIPVRLVTNPIETLKDGGGMTVPANSNVEFLSNDTVENYSKIRVAIRWNTTAMNDGRISIRYADESGNLIYEDESSTVFENGRTMAEFDVHFSRYQILVHNDTTTEQTIRRIGILGVR